MKGLDIPAQPVVQIGRTLGVLPPQPEPQLQPYELLRRRGNISKCNGCGVNFNKHDSQLFVLGRTEFEWYPKVQNNTKFYKVGSAKNVYYCILKRCVLLRRPLLASGSLKIVYVGSNAVPETVKNLIKEQFDTDHLITNWMF